MRRAVFAPGTVEDSAKLRRLAEIVEEATADAEKTIVFSFFRDVLDLVAAALGPKTVGPLTGSVPPSARQAMVGEFTARTGLSALVSQTQAGGVGLNIQAASVVIIAEPQWTPRSRNRPSPAATGWAGHLRPDGGSAGRHPGRERVPHRRD
jgi:SNF2 family DNA or RNA helicase